MTLIIYDTEKTLSWRTSLSRERTTLTFGVDVDKKTDLDEKHQVNSGSGINKLQTTDVDININSCV